MDIGIGLLFCLLFFILPDSKKDASLTMKLTINMTSCQLCRDKISPEENQKTDNGLPLEGN
jgi:hypothetical protein